MIELIVTLALDAILALLLVVTIGYCAKLNGRIKLLQDSKSELANLIRQFNDSTDRAAGSVVELQAVSKKVVEGLQTKIDKANFLADDLNFMIEKGNKLADQMEHGISSNRNPERRVTDAPRPAAAAPVQEAQVTSISPAAARGGAERLATNTQAARPAAAAPAQKSGTLESVLDKLAGKPGPGGKAAPTARIRSKAEQELLDALKRN